MIEQTFLDGRVILRAGDCLAVLRTFPDNHFDSVPCDPPYALVSIGKRFGASDAAPVIVPEGRSGAYARASAGFMGKQWDTGETAFAVEFWQEVLRVLKPGGHVVAFSGTRTYHRLAVAIEDAGFEIRDQLAWVYGTGFPKSHNAGNGWGTALKPAWEPMVFARKPLIGTVAANVLAHGTGAINIDACRVGWASEADKEAGRPASFAKAHPGFEGKSFAIADRSHRDPTAEQNSTGRWPANILHDGSDEVMGMFPNTTSGVKKGGQYARTTGVHEGGQRADGTSCFADSGSAARFFYSAKADANDRLGSKHPTVKPVDLMQWLVRLVTPKGGLVLDPFAGTGTTGEAAFREGMRAVLIEREEEYCADIARRMALVMAGPDERRRESIRAKAPKIDNTGTLFEAMGAL